MRRDAVSEYLRGALWAMPSLAVVVALIAGSTLSFVEVRPGSWRDRVLFQGTADDARTLLIAITSTMATVIALVLGLTVVALQLASTQFSPRLLRNFLRDRVNQFVLSVFVATFVYSSAGLYTVGVKAGERTDEYPRLAVTVALVLLFVSLLMLVFFVHHLTHSIQIDEVMRRVERTTLQVIDRDLPTAGVTTEPRPVPPEWAVDVPAYRSGYVQTIHPEALVAAAAATGVTASVTRMVGEHVIAGSALVQVWQDPPGPPPALDRLAAAARDSIRIGFERTAEQDVAFGVRQLADIAVKALSAAINDPYTSIQAIEHLSVVLAALARRELGSQLLRDQAGALRAVVPGRDLEYYLDLACGQVRRYGKNEPRVVRAQLRILQSTGQFCRDDAGRRLVVEQVKLLLTDAERAIVQPADFVVVRDHADRVLRDLTARGFSV
ncbi:DUF2254 domain-containing protein [Kribbella turkmenica]|uniref:DUF2254 domain-containing protein n=1 Tax=Kribbella turkmenica TaxID=2530375 RepID=A0A4R4X792_9ACTN|nr:DUF2254 domain-containing protein [Kribbella turkmenica]TDD26283.1 DUF2254 domain-containing protein [Kribbella turkmenica]